MIPALLAHWRHVVAALALIAAFASGVRYERGEQARRDADIRAAQDAAAAVTRAAEVARLQSETAADLHMGVITDEARADPDADLPAFGLRSAQRLNQIR